MLTKYKDVRPKKGVNKLFRKCFHVCGVFQIFFREGYHIYDIFSSVVFSSRVILKHIENKKGSRGVRGHATPAKFGKLTYCSGHFSTCLTIFRRILFKFFAPNSKCFTKHDAFCSYIFDYRCLGRRRLYCDRKSSKLWKNYIHQKRV